VPRLGDVVAALERRYDPRWAEPWDSVGLVCGDPDADVRHVLLAVDPVAAVVDEAIALGADLLVTHHPLFLGGTESVAATTAKGRVVHRLIRHDIGLQVAHTNADVARPGVSDALAAALGVRDTQPLQPSAADRLDKLTVFVPHPDAEQLVDALAAAGAGDVGAYSRCAYAVDGTGTFTPGAAANPAIGRAGRREEVAERRIEMVLPRARREAVVAALLTAHPYEEPAYDVVELVQVRGDRGLGRVGDLAGATTLQRFTETVAAALPATRWGVRAGGDPERGVRRVAVCGGSGGELAEAAARAGADVLVTSDLKHHATSEALADIGIGLVDAAHWATEQPWLRSAAELLVGDLGDAGTTVETTISTRVTDPWTMHTHRSED
jgi:dinuclear metal center YbgI/SA1388 family protein